MTRAGGLCRYCIKFAQIELSRVYSSIRKNTRSPDTWRDTQEIMLSVSPIITLLTFPISLHVRLSRSANVLIPPGQFSWTESWPSLLPQSNTVILSKFKPAQFSAPSCSRKITSQQKSSISTWTMYPTRSRQYGTRILFPLPFATNTAPRRGRGAC
jgi:hypothetical protein